MTFFHKKYFVLIKMEDGDAVHCFDTVSEARVDAKDAVAKGHEVAVYDGKMVDLSAMVA